MGLLKKLRKNIANDISSSSSFTKKKLGQGLDIADAISRRPAMSGLSYLAPGSRFADTIGTPGSYLNSGSRFADTVGLGAERVGDALNYTSDLGVGTFASPFFDYSRDQNGQVDTKLNLSKGLKIWGKEIGTLGLSSALQDEYKKRAEALGVKDYNPASFAPSQIKKTLQLNTKSGEAIANDPDIHPGVKFALATGLDPAMYIPVGGVGKLGRKLGTKAPWVAKALLGTEKAGASSRTARIAGGLLEGLGPKAPLFAAGGGLATEAASYIPGPMGTAAGFIAPMIGGGAAMNPKGLTKGFKHPVVNAIQDSPNPVFRDLAEYLSKNEALPKQAPAHEWGEILNKFGVENDELEANGFFDLIKNKNSNDIVTRQEIVDHINGINEIPAPFRDIGAGEPAIRTDEEAANLARNANLAAQPGIARVITEEQFGPSPHESNMPPANLEQARIAGTEYRGELPPPPEPPTTPPMRTAGGERYKGPNTNQLPVPTADSRPVTLRDYLNQIIWRNHELQRGEDPFGLGAGGNEAARQADIAKRQGQLYERPTTATDIGDIRLRAEELLNGLSEKELNQVIPDDVDFADLFHSIVNSREMDVQMQARAANSIIDPSAPKHVSSEGYTPPEGGYGASDPNKLSPKPVDVNTADTPEADTVIENALRGSDNVSVNTPTGITGNNPPSGGAGGLTPAGSTTPGGQLSGGLIHAGDIGTFKAKVAEIEKGGMAGSIKRAIQKIIPINPSILFTSPVGKLVVAYQRIGMDIRQQAVDAVDRAMGSGRAAGLRGELGFGHVFDLDEQGIIKNLGIHFLDLVEQYAKYADRLTPEQAKYTQGFIDLMGNDRRTLLSMHGIQTGPELMENGRVYMPRLVRSVDGLVLERPSNPNLKRAYEDATEAVKNGVDFKDPREIAHFVMVQTYKDIADTEFAREMSKVTDGADSLIKQGLANGYRSALDKYQTSLDDYKTAVENFNKAKASGNDQQIADAFAIEIQTKKAKDEARKALYGKAANGGPSLARRYKGAIERVNSLEYKNTKAIEGGTPERVAIRHFSLTKKGMPIGFESSRVVSPEDHEILMNFIGQRGVGLKEKEGGVAKVIGTFGRTQREGSAGTDLATGWTQLLPLLTRHPVQWGKAVASSYLTALNPEFAYKYKAANQDVHIRMANAGISIGATDYREAVGEHSTIGRAYNKTIGKVPVIGPAGGFIGSNTFGRFEQAYGTALMVARTEMWKALENDHGIMHTGILAKQMDDAGRAQYIRNMTGGLDSKALMVAKGQRDVESTILAFSPKLTRSVIGLVGMTLKPTTAEGQQAIRSLVALAAFSGGIIYAANYYLNGKDVADESVNPTTGRKFMAVKTGMGYIGIGGLHRAMAQLIGNSAETIKTGSAGNFLTWDQQDNPLLNFYIGRSAPGVTLGQNTIEATTGVNSNPYNEVHGLFGLGDWKAGVIPTSATGLVPITAKSMIPFTAQAMIDGQDLKQAAVGMNGLRVTPFSRSEETQMRLVAAGYKDLDGNPIQKVSQLNREQRAKFFNDFPVERVNKDDNITKMYSAIDQEESTFLGQLNYFSSLVDSGKMSKEQFRVWFNDAKVQKVNRVNGIKQAFSLMPADRPGFDGSVTDYINSKTTTEEDKAVANWYSIPSSIKLRDDGTVDFDAISKARTNLLSSLPPAKRAYVERMTTKESQIAQNKTVTEYDIVKDIVKPYFESDETVFAQIKSSSGFLSQFKDYAGYQEWIVKLAQESGVTPETMQSIVESKVPDIKGMNKILSYYRKAMKLSNPQLDRALTEWYGMQPANPIDYTLSQYGMDTPPEYDESLLTNRRTNSRRVATALGMQLRGQQRLTQQYHRPTISLK